MNIAKIIDGNTIHVYDLTQFDIDAIMHSGQVFRYFPIPEASGTAAGYRLIAGGNLAEIRPAADKIIIKSDNSAYFFNYFDLQTDYNEIKRELQSFEKLRPAIDAGGGIRILRAEFVETVISFIISANNNIKRFTKTLNNLAERYGDKLSGSFDGIAGCPAAAYAFPTPAQLSQITEAEFKMLGCGYRSLYLVKAAAQLQALDPGELAQLPDAALTKRLCGVSGIGPKVCSCVMLFTGSLHRIGVAPVDTHIRKAIEQLGETDAGAILGHKYAGIAQQYIFYYIQHLHKGL